MSSFISEHTAEFVLVPKLLYLLNESFAQVIPIYFWATREGNSFSVSEIGDKRVKILSLYPRRPKIYGYEKNLFLKVNYYLVHRNKYLQENGICNFFGVPIAKSLLELGLNTKCNWFYLEKNAECFDQEFPIINTIPTNRKGLIGPLKKQNILNYIESISQEMEYSDFVKIIRNREMRGNFNPFFSNQYKTVYFVLHN